MSESLPRGEDSGKIGKTFSIASVVIGSYILYNLWKQWNKPDPNITIKSLYVYPVKSCKGFEVKKWKLSKYGMKYDREWLIYSPKTKRRISQRETSKMALISVKLIFLNGNDAIDCIDGTECVKGIEFCAPKMEDIFVPVNNDEKNKVKNIIVFKDKVNGIDQGNEISKWFTNYLNNDNDKNNNIIREYRLMRITSKHHRSLYNSEQSVVISNKNVPENLINSASTPFTDAFPLLIVADASLYEINKRLQKKNLDKIEINRFRPNIVIQSDVNEPFFEDRISELKHISNNDNKNKTTIFYLRAPAPRCVVPTINQSSGIMNKDSEPTMTLKQFRTGKHLGFRQFHDKVFFGMFAVHNNYDVVIQKGDSMTPSFV